MAPPSPFKDRPEYQIATKLASDLADLLAPQSGAYYDIWLDGEKFVSSTFEVCLSFEDRGAFLIRSYLHMRILFLIGENLPFSIAIYREDRKSLQHV